MKCFNAKNIFPALLLLTVLLSVWACKEEEDYVQDDPSLDMVLYNVDSLVQVQYILDSLGDTLKIMDDTLKYYSDLASDLTDSILVLTVLIENGDDSYVQIRTDLSNQLISINLIYNEFYYEDSILDASYKEKTATKSTINKGSLKISSITNKVNGQVVYYEDSATVWPLPLDMNNDVSDLILEIGGKTYDIKLNYNRSIITNEYGEVLVKTYGFTEDQIEYSSGIDSIKLRCKTLDCIDFESTLYIYF
ncbi:hypothetical protein N6H18_12290 [Reichenbachiella agarivorans]|uniref:Uncharacterized protein n=1 Tax=Reichenbachiella agarivorans TaxID=2979464 RepID=A0ABY6CKT6_9BACT|nr:hypothetical protein [Reichenbachiella agarivorans]UXP31128.1 hypothetical protein N6H18_12290 [Reichenbachiella agarivorans]